MLRLGDTLGLARRGIIALPRAVDQVVLPHLLGDEIDLTVTTPAGIIAGNIVGGHNGRHAIVEVMKLECSTLGHKQQAVSRAVEHREIGGPLDALKQTPLRGHFHLLGHRRQQHCRCKQ